MRPLPLIAIALLLTAPAALLVPTTQAFGWCSDAVPGRECWSHWTCIGIRRNHQTQQEWCQYEIPYPCDRICRDPCDWLWYCGPGPYLP